MLNEKKQKTLSIGLQTGFRKHYENKTILQKYKILFINFKNLYDFENFINSRSFAIPLFRYSPLVRVNGCVNRCVCPPCLNSFVTINESAH